MARTTGRAADRTIASMVKKSKSGRGTLTYTPDKEDLAEMRAGKGRPSAAEEAREAKKPPRGRYK